MKFLVVEDDYISRIVLQKMLSPYGNCEVAANGKEAVQAFSISVSEGEPYDLICLDIMMPEMNGKEALKLIRQKEKEMNTKPREETAIIMVTALDTPKDVIESYYKGGCNSYIVKPIEKQKLINVLKELKLISY